MAHHGTLTEQKAMSWCMSRMFELTGQQRGHGALGVRAEAAVEKFELCFAGGRDALELAKEVRCFSNCPRHYRTVCRQTYLGKRVCCLQILMTDGLPGVGNS